MYPSFSGSCLVHLRIACCHLPQAHWSTVPISHLTPSSSACHTSSHQTQQTARSLSDQVLPGLHGRKGHGREGLQSWETAKRVMSSGECLYLPQAWPAPWRKPQNTYSYRGEISLGLTRSCDVSSLKSVSKDAVFLLDMLGSLTLRLQEGGKGREMYD